MKKWLKRVLVGLVVLLLVTFVGGAVFLLTFDPNAYKYKLEEIVRSNYDRDLQINGDIELSLFPRIGLSVNQLSLSEPGNDDVFVSINSARFAVAIWPLISNRFVVDHVAVSGFKAWVVRDETGHLNFEDLFEQKNTAVVADSLKESVNANTVLPQPYNTDFKIDIAGLELQNGEVYFRDISSHLDMRLKNMTINTGRVTFDQPFDITLAAQLEGDRPKVNAQLNVQGLLKLDPVTKLYNAQKLEVALKGRLGDIDASSATLKGSFNIDSFAHAITGSGMELVVAGNGVEGSALKKIDINVSAPKLSFDSSAPLLLLENFSVKGSAQNVNDQSYEWSFESPALDISSTVAGGKPLVGFLRMKGREQVGVNLSLKGISGSADNLKVAEVKIDGKYAQANNRVIGLNISSPAQMNLIDRIVMLSAISGNASFKDQGLEEQLVPVIGSINADFQKSRASFKLDAVVNAGKFNLDGELHHFSSPNVNFDLNADSINLDQLLGPVPSLAVAEKNNTGNGKAVTTPESASAQKEKTATAQTAETTQAQPEQQAPASVTSLKRELLQSLRGMGTVNLKQMRYQDVVFNDVQAIFRFDRANLDMTSFKSWVFDGQVRADAQFDLAKDEIKAGIELEAIDLSLMQQAFHWTHWLSGRAFIKLQLESNGANEKMILENIKGQVQVKAENGLVNGFDINQLVHDPLKYLDLDTPTYPFAMNYKVSTPYSLVSVDAQVDKGVAQLASLLFESGQFAVQGSPNEMVFNWNNGDFKLPVTLKTRQPVKISQNNITLSIKEINLPVMIERAGQTLTVTLQWDKLKDSPLGKLLEKKKEQALKEQAAKEQLDVSVPEVPASPTEADTQAVSGASETSVPVQQAETEKSQAVPEKPDEPVPTLELPKPLTDTSTVPDETDDTANIEPAASTVETRKTAPVEAKQ
ncbi:AsmA family protein [Advenella sp. WQ 585]|uniref:AsmA family protein n=1 Tax=Advenella mandrilli TaxID=2800330 RepID=A0ABS1EFB9_9BURK|nr:AsmA family protein [Advenella mandrilli]MBK1781679.1 AsmA family protein [Advenella mandrilli]